MGKIGKSEKTRKDIRHFRDLDVYRLAFDCAMRIFKLTKFSAWPI